MKSRKSYFYLFSLILALSFSITKANANEDGVVAFKFDTWMHGQVSGRLYWHIVQAQGKEEATFNFWVGEDKDGIAPEKAIAVSNLDASPSKNGILSLQEVTINITNFYFKKYQAYSSGQESIRIIFGDDASAVIIDAGKVAKRKASEFEYFIVDYINGEKNPVAVRATQQKQDGRRLKFMMPEIPMTTVKLDTDEK
ncbi:MAG: hypothetical protein K0R14_1622 [Burkholderiales bacterium]|jgi:hypothetical protein|nr:hypothetical protein [Burkholderiales bacterium]